MKKNHRVFGGKRYKIYFLIPVGLVIDNKITFDNIRHPCSLHRKY